MYHDGAVCDKGQSHVAGLGLVQVYSRPLVF